MNSEVSEVLRIFGELLCYGSASTNLARYYPPDILNIFWSGAGPTRWPASCDRNVKSLSSDDRKTWILIVFSMQIVAPDERRTALLRMLGSMLGPTRVAPGCLDARLYTDLDKRKTLVLVEDWESREQFERNLDTGKLNAIVAAIELSSEAPVVRVDAVEREEGVDVLALHRTVAEPQSEGSRRRQTGNSPR
jgi:quinol monooxygenase YgiN